MAPLGLSQPTALKIMFILYAALGSTAASSTAASQSGSRLGSAPPHRARTLAPYRLQLAGAVQHRCVRWRLCRAVAAGAVAVREVRPVAGDRGRFFFWSGVLAAFSFPVAAWLSRRIGLVNTMVYTHIPSSIALILAAVAPSVDRSGPAARARGAVADGCADALLLRHGGGHAGGTGGGGELDIGAPQPCGGGQPSARRRHVAAGSRPGRS